jgi:hypothetical protein
MGIMCSYCGSAIFGDRKPGFNEACEGCGKDLHACLNCRFYRQGARWDCAETIQEPVSDKEHRNRCDWYETNPALLVAGPGRIVARNASEKAKRDLDKLFGG